MHETATEPFLYLSQVNVARGDNVVLHDINLTVNAGRAHRSSWAQWVREVDADQDDYV